MVIKIRDAEKLIEKFYSDLKIDISQFFPEVPEEHKSNTSLNPMNILLCGSYRPGIVKLMQSYEQGASTPDQKLENGEELLLSERMLLVQRILEKLGHTVMFGNRNHREIRNTRNRLLSLIDESDHIVMLLNNTGGIVYEHAMVTENQHSSKTAHYIKQGEDLSGLMLQGSLLLPQTKAMWYKDDRHLADLVIRTTEAYQKDVDSKSPIGK